MKRKPAQKKSPSTQSLENGRIVSNGVPKKKPLLSRHRKYLDSTFTERLLQHMHAAKKAALSGKE
jgi:hypothetical protein